MAGLDVLLLEKTAFPREKVCGDGLTPRAVKQLIAMGIDTSEDDGWIRNHGLRIIGGGMRLELRWPDLAQLPALRPGPHPRWTSTTSSPGTRVKAGARLLRAHQRHRPGRSTSAPAAIVGVTAKPSTRTAARPAPS